VCDNERVNVKSTPYIDQKTDGGTVYKQILINAKLQTGQRGQKTELTGRSPLRRRRCALGCIAIEEGGGGGEEEEGAGGVLVSIHSHTT
jgi:hypothetical protein